jgi:hypothetical protein
MKKNIKLLRNSSKPTVVTPTEQMALRQEDAPLIIRLNFGLDQEVYEQLKSIAKKEATPIAGLVRQWVARGIRHYCGHEVLHLDGTRCPIDLMSKIKGG